MSNGSEPQNGAAARLGRKRNHVAWFGPILVFLGAVSYFQVFVFYPGLRDFPWVNLPLVWIGLGLTGLGLWRAYARSAVYRGKILGCIGMFLSIALAGLFHFYVFYFSYHMPAAGLAATMQEAPDFVLTDQNGQQVRLSDFRGKKVVLTFYRGYW